ncbi:hypothetical protein DY000_02024949 [Brassica cretica]|uniref:Uncharacterized protein n=1 Tax=Brassica cretica TaxID=69181 RepID=A0ABQ7EDU7_BRACR|nr:hypothetical protein DY000_02024949 [Brassica cretica]
MKKGEWEEGDSCDTPRENERSSGDDDSSSKDDDLSSGGSSRTSDVLQTDPRRPTNIAVSHFGDRSPHEPDLFEDESAAVWDRMD